MNHRTPAEEIRARLAAQDEEIAALRDLLAAVASALPPLPADPADMGLYREEAARRLSYVATWAEPETDIADGFTTDIIAGRATALRSYLARPLRYEPRTETAEGGAS